MIYNFLTYEIVRIHFLLRVLVIIWDKQEENYAYFWRTEVVQGKHQHGKYLIIVYLLLILTILMQGVVIILLLNKVKEILLEKIKSNDSAFLTSIVRRNKFTPANKNQEFSGFSPLMLHQEYKHPHWRHTWLFQPTIRIKSQWQNLL